MSKSKNKGKKPAQNNKKSNEEIDVKIDKEVEEKVSEEAADEAAEDVVDEAVDEAAEEVVDEVMAEEPSKEDNSDKADEAEDTEEDDKAEKAEEKKEKKSESSAKKKPMSKKAKEREANAKFRALPFGEKCKKDPVIPVCIGLIFVAVIVASIYFIVPNAITPTMGITLEEFETNFNQAQVIQSLLGSGLDFRYNNVPYVDPAVEPGILGDQAVITGNPGYVDFFAGPSRSTINSGIEGATRKTDGELSYVRTYIEYTEDFNPVWMLLSGTIQALYPEVQMTEAMDIALIKLGEYNGDTRFYVKGDYGFRIVPVQKGEVTYIVVDVVPAKILDATQIRENLDTPAVAVTESAVDTAATSAPAT